MSGPRKSVRDCVMKGKTMLFGKKRSSGMDIKSLRALDGKSVEWMEKVTDEQYMAR